MSCAAPGGLLTKRVGCFHASVGRMTHVVMNIPVVRPSLIPGDARNSIGRAQERLDSLLWWPKEGSKMEMEKAVLEGLWTQPGEGGAAAFSLITVLGKGGSQRTPSPCGMLASVQGASCSSLAHMQFSEVASPPILYEIEGGPGCLLVLVSFLVKWLKYFDKGSVRDKGNVLPTFRAGLPPQLTKWSPVGCVHSVVYSRRFSLRHPSLMILDRASWQWKWTHTQLRMKLETRLWAFSPAEHQNLFQRVPWKHGRLL